MDKRMEKEVLAHLESGEKIASEEYSNPALTIPVVRSDPAIPRPGPGRSQTGYGRVTNTGPHHICHLRLAGERDRCPPILIQGLQHSLCVRWIGGLLHDRE